MSLSHALKWCALIPLAGAGLVGCGAFEPPPRDSPHATVTFDVTVPDGTPSDAVLTVLGSDAVLGEDTAPGFHLRRGPDGHYTGMVRLAVSAQVSYALWRQDVWTPEVSADGAPVPRRTFQVAGDMTERAQVLRWGEPLRASP